VISFVCKKLKNKPLTKTSLDNFFHQILIVLNMSHLLFIRGGGTIIIWMSSRFSGQVIYQNDYAMSVEFEFMISGDIWVITNVYAPCTLEGKVEFMN
jgi:hypothetical protein